MIEAIAIKSLIVWFILYGAFVAHVYRDKIKKFFKYLSQRYGTYRGKNPPPKPPKDNDETPKEDK